MDGDNKTPNDRGLFRNIFLNCPVLPLYWEIYYMHIIGSLSLILLLLTGNFTGRLGHFFVVINTLIALSL